MRMRILAIGIIGIAMGAGQSVFHSTEWRLMDDEILPSPIHASTVPERELATPGISTKHGSPLYPLAGPETRVMTRYEFVRKSLESYTAFTERRLQELGLLRKALHHPAEPSDIHC